MTTSRNLKRKCDQDNNNRGWKYISSNHLHALNQLLAVLLQACCNVLIIVLQITGVFASSIEINVTRSMSKKLTKYILYSGRNYDNSSSVFWFYIVDRWDTVSWVYLIFSTMYICIQRSVNLRKVHVQFN